MNQPWTDSDEPWEGQTERKTDAECQGLRVLFISGSNTDPVGCTDVSTRSKYTETRWDRAERRKVREKGVYRNVMAAQPGCWFRGARASRPAENVPNLSESGLTSTPRSVALHLCSSPIVRRGLLTSDQAPVPPPGPSIPDLVFHHAHYLASPGPATPLLNRDPPDPGSSRVAATSSRPRSGEGGTRERSHRSQALRHVLNQSKSNKRWSQGSDPGGRISAWALKPFHQARLNWGDRNSRRRGNWGSTHMPSKEGSLAPALRKPPTGGRS